MPQEAVKSYNMPDLSDSQQSQCGSDGAFLGLKKIIIKGLLTSVYPENTRRLYYLIFSEKLNSIET